MAVTRRALNAARRSGLHELAGEAHHHLFHVWADLGDLRRAYEHARSARELFGEAHHLLYRLAADLGRVTAKVGTPAESGGAVASQAGWILLANKELPNAVRYAAAIDLAHAARTGGDLRAFTWAKRVVLELAPRAEYADVVERMGTLWPDGEAPPMDRAS